MITKPYRIKDEWAVKIIRKNGGAYVARSVDLESIIDYRNEYLATARAKQARGR